MTFSSGLVIGKFLPPHRGHELLIATAVDQSESVTVIVCGKPTDPIPGTLRQAWLRELFPQANVLLIDDRYDAQDSRLWARNVIRWLGKSPDAVFTSEDYGDRFASFLGCRHIEVDRDRRRVACSGTAIRQDPFAHWDYLPPPVRAWYAKRICILGAESTGTTSLSIALSERYQTSWVEEYGREYSEDKYARGEMAWSSVEFIEIAREQDRREAQAARLANRLLICDTNSLATYLWHRRYLGVDSAELKSIGDAARCDLYVLTGDEIPFVQDGIRDGEHIRHTMHGWFRELLGSQNIPWIEVRGSHHERIALADQSIRELFVDSDWPPPFVDTA